MLSNVRYGAKIRKLYVKAQQSQRRRYECSKCGKLKVRRISYAHWRCKGCDAEFAGGAYAFHTEGGTIALRMLVGNKG